MTTKPLQPVSLPIIFVAFFLFYLAPHTVAQESKKFWFVTAVDKDVDVLLMTYVGDVTYHTDVHAGVRAALRDLYRTYLKEKNSSRTYTYITSHYDLSLKEAIEHQKEMREDYKKRGYRVYIDKNFSIPNTWEELK